MFLISLSLSLLSRFDPLPQVKRIFAEKKVKFYVIDAVGIAYRSGGGGCKKKKKKKRMGLFIPFLPHTFSVGLGRRANQVLQAVFFKLGEVLPVAEAITLLKEYISGIYAKKGRRPRNLQPL